MNKLNLRPGIYIGLDREIIISHVGIGACLSDQGDRIRPVYPLYGLKLT